VCVSCSSLQIHVPSEDLCTASTPGPTPSPWSSAPASSRAQAVERPVAAKANSSSPPQSRVPSPAMMTQSAGDCASFTLRASQCRVYQGPESPVSRSVLRARSETPPWTASYAPNILYLHKSSIATNSYTDFCTRSLSPYHDRGR